MRNKENRLIILVTLVPLIVFYCVFLIYPIIHQLVGSFFKWNPLIDQFDFVGLRNYYEVIRDISFWKSLFNTFYFTCIVLVLRTAIGLLLAVLINNVRYFKAFFRTAYFMPVVTSMVAVALVWKWMYDPSIGVFNAILSSLGFDGLGWLKDSKLALPSIMLMSIWKDAGFAMVLYLAAMSNIPVEFYEAARLDGGNNWQILRHITLPLVKPATVFVLITGTITYLQTYTQVFIMTGGGPGDASSTVVFLIWKEAFTKWNFGYASAITQVLFIIILLLGLIQLKYMRSYWHV
ncbi:MAG: sugar ABC transporter permease [Actinobacteria bacterium]|nr:sugar ABC transporter permease [Actinomycetota bacterium]